MKKTIFFTAPVYFTMSALFFLMTSLCLGTATEESDSNAPSVSPESASNNSASTSSATSTERGYFLFSYFTGNGEDGLHFAASRDALHWTACKDGKPFLAPISNPKKNLVRDPSICRGPDGVWHAVWTSSWDGKHIGISSSRDLIHWVEPVMIPTMLHEPTTRNSWAPELFYDDTTEQFFIFWSSSIPGRFGQEACGDDNFDHRAYVMVTKDFETFSKPRLYFEPGHSVIDGFLLKKDGTYYLFYKDERLKPEKKIINLATAESAEGPFTPKQTISPRNWVEGPSALAVGDDVFVYYDCYIDGCYGGVRTKDFQNWEDIESKISFPENARHGTAFEVDRETYERVVNAK